jgi:hypothetical protein
MVDYDARLLSGQRRLDAAETQRTHSVLDRARYDDGAVERPHWREEFATGRRGCGICSHRRATRADGAQGLPLSQHEHESRHWAAGSIDLDHGVSRRRTLLQAKAANTQCLVPRPVHEVRTRIARSSSAALA